MRAEPKLQRLQLGLLRPRQHGHQLRVRVLVRLYEKEFRVPFRRRLLLV